MKNLTRGFASNTLAIMDKPNEAPFHACAYRFDEADSSG
jgi:hypothetical protein